VTDTAPTSLRVLFAPPLYGSFRYRPETHPDGFRQSGWWPLHFAYSGWRSGTVTSSARYRSRIQVNWFD